MICIDSHWITEQSDQTCVAIYLLWTLFINYWHHPDPGRIHRRCTRSRENPKTVAVPFFWIVTEYNPLSEEILFAWLDDTLFELGLAISRNPYVVWQLSIAQLHFITIIKLWLLERSRAHKIMMNGENIPISQSKSLKRKILCRISKNMNLYLPYTCRCRISKTISSLLSIFIQFQ